MTAVQHLDSSPRRRPPPTPLNPEQHAEIGRALCRVRGAIEIELAQQLFIGRGRSPVVGYWRKATRQINRLRSRLDGLYFQQNPRREGWEASSYYGSDDVPHIEGADYIAFIRAQHRELERVGGILDGHVAAPINDLHAKALHAVSALGDVLRTTSVRP